MKIFIGGLLPNQQRIIEAACHNGVELRFAASDKDPRSWARAGRHCDYCILVTDFVGHMHCQRLEAAGCNALRHVGGITRLKALLLELSKRAP